VVGKISSENGFKILRVDNVEYVSPPLAFLGRERASKLVELDVKISKLLPKIFISGWLFVLKKI